MAVRPGALDLLNMPGIAQPSAARHWPEDSTGQGCLKIARNHLGEVRCPSQALCGAQFICLRDVWSPRTEEDDIPAVGNLWGQQCLHLLSRHGQLNLKCPEAVTLRKGCPGMKGHSLLRGCLSLGHLVWADLGLGLNRRLAKLFEDSMFWGSWLFRDLQ